VPDTKVFRQPVAATTPVEAAPPGGPNLAAAGDEHVDDADSEPAAVAMARGVGEGSPAARTPVMITRQASEAGLHASPYRSIHERLAGCSPNAASAGRASPGFVGSPAPGLPVTSPKAADAPIAGGDELLNRSWLAWVAALQQRTGEHLDREFTKRMMQQLLWRAQKILSKVSTPNLERPVGYLVWLLREAEGALPPKANDLPSRPAHAKLPSSASSAPARTASSRNAQPSDDPLRASLPLAAVGRGDAGNLAAESLFCMSCAVRAP
jgi:hypothetical protein